MVALSPCDGSAICSVLRSNRTSAENSCDHGKGTGKRGSEMGDGVLKTYRDLLPITSATPMITLGEGDTPLVKSNRLAAELGCPELYFKLEGCNPTGSFKDRGMVVAIAKALEEGSRAIMCASTGNTSASAAAFGAYSGLPALVIIPRGEVAMGKLAQAMAYGAKIIMVNGNFDTALGLVRDFHRQARGHAGQFGQPLFAWKGRRPQHSRLLTPLATPPTTCSFLWATPAT